MDLGTGQSGRVSRIHCTILGPEVSSLEEVIAQIETRKFGAMRPAFHRMSLCKSGDDEDDERGNFGLRVSNFNEFTCGNLIFSNNFETKKHPTAQRRQLVAIS
jgi:hypothetical protein